MTGQRSSTSRNPVLLFLICSLTLAIPPSIIPQAAPDVDYRAKRQKATDLFSLGKRLEALPLLESLVHTNPKDDEMLVALAACLIDHAATLNDQEAAARERFRAKDLLER